MTTEDKVVYHTMGHVLAQVDPQSMTPSAESEQFIAAEFAAIDAGKYHPTVRPARCVELDADPSMVRYDRAIASLSPKSGKPTLH